MYQVEHLERGPAGIAEDVNPLPMYSPSETDLPSWASPKEEESLPSWASSKEDESPMAECKVSITSYIGRVKQKNIA